LCLTSFAVDIVFRNKSARVCERCGGKHNVKDTRRLESGTIKRAMICSQCGKREHTFEIKVWAAEGETLTSKEKALLLAMEKVK